jgi:acetylornithine deacetylase/succinyl-diaminopimelate desuccinylase-like protein
MKKITDWLASSDAKLVADLAKLVAIPSISTDGEHQRELEHSAELTCDLMRETGLNNVGVLRSGASNPYAYGEWLGAAGKPTVFLYAHHDVQPVNFAGDWLSDPWTLTERDGRLYGRGSADDKGAIAVQLGAIAAHLKTAGSLPVNVKMLVEGEEEVGSKNLDAFFHEHKDRLLSDVIVVCDSENIDTGIPSITYSLRGIVACLVEVQSATKPVHSGMAGGMLADAALALNVILSRLYWKNGKIPIPGFYDKVRKLTGPERRACRKLPGDEASWRRDMGVLDGVSFALEGKTHPYEQTWRRPAVTVIAQEASSIKGASNQVLPKASAIVSCRIVPDQDPAEVYEQIKAHLTKDPPWGVKVSVKPAGSGKWWITDPQGPAFEAALKSLKKGYAAKPLAIGCGGSIGFVGPLAELFGGAPALLLGIEDPKTNAHAPNESLHAGDFRKLTMSLAYLFDNLGNLPESAALKGSSSPGSEPAETVPATPTPPAPG